MELLIRMRAGLVFTFIGGGLIGYAVPLEVPEIVAASIGIILLTVGGAIE